MNRVLIISYYFPPRPGVGGLRPYGLAKYLPHFGWEPIILTAKLPYMDKTGFKIIETEYPGDVTDLLKKKLGLEAEVALREQIKLPNKIRGKRNSSFNKIINIIKTFVCYPDDQKYWLKHAIKAGDYLLRSEKIDAIISTSGPVTCHMIANELKSKYKKKWIADFRDLWTQNHYYPYAKPRMIIERNLERRTLTNADLLVTVSEPWAINLRSLHSNKRVIAIPNGYDFESTVFNTELTRNFSITYTGQLYQGKRDPSNLFIAIKELVSKQIIERSKIKIRFYGPKETWLQNEVDQLGLSDVVEINGYVPRDVSLKKQRESQILLILNWNHADETGTLPAKVFEYLAAKRPILAIGGPKGALSNLLEETGAGYHASDLSDVRDCLIHLYGLYKEYGFVPFGGNENKIYQYSQLKMAERFAQVL